MILLFTKKGKVGRITETYKGLLWQKIEQTNQPIVHVLWLVIVTVGAKSNRHNIDERERANSKHQAANLLRCFNSLKFWNKSLSANVGTNAQYWYKPNEEEK